MLQGIFEPVAERKKGTLEEILNDFPDRKFLLVGDSGEADLEVYADVAEAYHGRIIGVFIRDVTTPEQSGYFDSAMNSSAGQRRTVTHKSSRLRRRSTDDGSATRPALPARNTTEPMPPQGPVMGDLIDFSREPAQFTSSETQQISNLNSESQNAAKKPPPPRPAKPTSLKSSPATSTPPTSTSKPPSLSGRTGNHPLAQMHNSSQQSQLDLSRSTSSNNDRRPSGTSTTSASSRGPAPPPPPPRRRGTPTAASSLSLSPKLMAAKRRGTGNSDADNIESLPAPSFYNPSYGARSPSGQSSGASSPSSLMMEPVVNKKLELWRRRLERAQERLEREGVALYTWRRGEDVIHEADGLVRGRCGRWGLRWVRARRGI
ncbi:putative actin cytoskeleton organization and biogenesis [Apiospora phragmitis]|uniref:Actin cytoskeleton organization and biogenesis n=1 Tax=Apiospora phragmitis TaxID=2905665 RepID=A0ABR1VXS2_9PEZI